jgi:hypothetical protein
MRMETSPRSRSVPYRRPPPGAERVRYRLAVERGGERSPAVLYDNHEPKGHGLARTGIATIADRQCRPPEALILSPVSHAASSDARNTTTGAISCG